MEKVKFYLDDGSNFEPYRTKETGLFKIGLNVEDEEENINHYFSNINIDRKKIFDILERGLSIKTEQPIYGVVLEELREALENNDKVIVISLSKKLTGFYDSLISIKKELNNKNLIIVDSLSVGISGNWTLEELKKSIENDEIEVSQKTINNFVNSRQKKICGAVIISNPKHLINGGRIKGFKGLIAKTLKLKFVVKFDGGLNLADKDVKLDNAIEKAIIAIDKEINFKKHGIKRISFMNDINEEGLNDLVYNAVKSYLGTDFEYTNSLLPECVVSHVGLDTFSILIESNK